MEKIINIFVSILTEKSTINNYYGIILSLTIILFIQICKSPVDIICKSPANRRGKFKFFLRRSLSLLVVNPLFLLILTAKKIIEENHGASEITRDNLWKTLKTLGEKDSLTISNLIHALVFTSIITVIAFVVLCFYLNHSYFYTKKKLNTWYSNLIKEQKEHGQLKIIEGVLDFLGEVLECKNDGKQKKFSPLESLRKIRAKRNGKCTDCGQWEKCYKNNDQYITLSEYIGKGGQVSILCHDPLQTQELLESTGPILVKLLSNFGKAENDKNKRLLVRFYNELKDGNIIDNKFIGDLNIRGRIIQTNENNYKACLNYKIYDKWFSKPIVYESTGHIGQTLLLAWHAMWEDAMRLDDLDNGNVGELIKKYNDLIHKRA
ncbi:hypothetical protein AGMMS50268_36340 [Spirochaetia bacterium]|nr:hypothetical protein AGMMS50268_36340 [Spirochaetia bacterium]